MQTPMQTPMQSPNPTIETARLRLRQFTPVDLNAYHQLIYGDDEVMRYLPPGGAIPRERVVLALGNIAFHWRNNGFGLWAVEERNGAFLGHCGLIWLEDTPHVEVAYALARTSWGRGYATEAARASLWFGFERMGLERIVAIARPENIASCRVMENLGMRYRRPAHHYGFDVVFYDVTRTDFVLNGAPHTLL